ncbi:Peptidase M12A [Trinorchestia longiramus]|nr:Peptidase M12A [Trinorchestia longiramus]
MKSLLVLWCCVAVVVTEKIGNWRKKDDLKSDERQRADAEDDDHLRQALEQERLMQHKMLNTDNMEVLEGLFEGDILLTEAQKMAMMERKVIDSERSWWPKSADGTVTVNYRIANGDNLDLNYLNFNHLNINYLNLNYLNLNYLNLNYLNLNYLNLNDLNLNDLNLNSLNLNYLNLNYLNLNDLNLNDLNLNSLNLNDLNLNDLNLNYLNLNYLNLNFLNLNYLNLNYLNLNDLNLNDLNLNYLNLNFLNLNYLNLNYLNLNDLNLNDLNLNSLNLNDLNLNYLNLNYLNLNYLNLNFLNLNYLNLNSLNLNDLNLNYLNLNYLNLNSLNLNDLSLNCLGILQTASTLLFPHLIFQSSDSGCYSYIGRIQNNGQPVNLAQGCLTSVGTPIHEIGHAMGFFHEQSRNDRDDFVLVALENVRSGMENNFMSQTTNNFQVPYDYYSVMHYGSDYFTKNNKDTLVAIQPYGQALMGQRDYFSFMDIRLANLQYSCIEKYLSDCGATTDPCQNYGFFGKDCSCVCPEGTSGTNCENLDTPYIDALTAKATPNSETFTTEGTVTTPGYPSPYSGSGQYVQVIRAPNCQKVQLTFTVFSLQPPLYEGRCYFNKFTLRKSDDLLQSDTYCGTDISPGTVFESENSTILIFFSSNSDVPAPGYSADIVFIDKETPECATTAPPTTPAITTPAITTPLITTPAITTPAITTPAITTPLITTIAISTPAITTPAITTPLITTPAITTPLITTPAITTPAITTPSITIPPITTPSITIPPITTPVITTPLITTPPTTSPITIINSGVIGALGLVVSGECTLRSTGDFLYILSPSFPLVHLPRTQCSIQINTTEPRILSVLPVTVGVTRRDDMTVDGVYQDSEKITRRDSGTNIIFPSSRASFSYTAKPSGISLPFFLYIRTGNNECHQVIELSAGASGTLELPETFSSSPICEWWVRVSGGSGFRFAVGSCTECSGSARGSPSLVPVAPAGMRVKVSVEDFNAGNRRCDRAYALINFSGGDYNNNQFTHKLCRKQTRTVISLDSEIDILVNGLRANAPRFTATYSVI